MNLILCALRIRLIWLNLYTIQITILNWMFENKWKYPFFFRSYNGQLLIWNAFNVENWIIVCCYALEGREILCNMKNKELNECKKRPKLSNYCCLSAGMQLSANRVTVVKSMRNFFFFLNKSIFGWSPFLLHLSSLENKHTIRLIYVY